MLPQSKNNDKSKPVGNNPVGNNPVGNNPVGNNPVGNNPVGNNQEEKPLEGTPPAPRTPPKPDKQVTGATKPAKPVSKTDNKNMFSARVPDEWFDLVEILMAKHKRPGKTIGPILTETLKRGMELEDEAELNATVYQHPTLDGEEYMRIRAGYAPITKCLKSFRADLLQIDQYPDDEERTEKLIELCKLTQDALEGTLTLNTRLARIALLPDVPDGDDFQNLLQLRHDFTKAMNEAPTPEERAKWSLALKLIGPYLP